MIVKTNDHEDYHNQGKNSHRLCDEMRYPFVNLESQWKLRQQRDQNFPIEGKAFQNMLAPEERNKLKRARQ